MSMTRKLNLVSEEYEQTKKFCMETFKNPEMHILETFEHNVTTTLLTEYSNLKVVRSKAKEFSTVEREQYKPIYQTVNYSYTKYEVPQCKKVQEVEHLRLLELKEQFENLVEDRQKWIIEMFYKTRELHKHPLYKAKALLIGKIKQYKNQMEAIERYHLHVTSVKLLPQDRQHKKLEVFAKNHKRKMQILYAEWAICDELLPKFETRLKRFEKAIKNSESYQALLEDIKVLRSENSLFNRQKKQIQRIYKPYMLFHNMAVWEFEHKRYSIILSYPKIV